MKKPVTITITGAAGNIGYALAFRVASGQMLGGGPTGQPQSAGDTGGQCGRCRVW